jgi:nicotinamidase-related amidase
MKALVIIDVQKAMFAGAPPYDGEAVVARIAGMLDRARRIGAVVFHVQHDGGLGDEFCRGEPGFDICDAVKPAEGELVLVKTTRSAFASTPIDAALRAAAVDHIVMAGMQTEFCLNTTLLGAVDRGYRATVVRDGHTTFDNEVLPAEKIIALHHRIWLGKMAELVLAADITF